jgi:hypothetical protein
MFSLNLNSNWVNQVIFCFLIQMHSTLMTSYSFSIPFKIFFLYSLFTLSLCVYSFFMFYLFLGKVLFFFFGMPTQKRGGGIWTSDLRFIAWSPVNWTTHWRRGKYILASWTITTFLFELIIFFPHELTFSTLDCIKLLFTYQNHIPSVNLVKKF